MNSASSIVTASVCRLVQGRSFHKSYCDIAVSGGARNEDLSFFEEVELAEAGERHQQRRQATNQMLSVASAPSSPSLILCILYGRLRVQIAAGFLYCETRQNSCILSQHLSAT